MRNQSYKYWKKILDTATKKGLDAIKPVSGANSKNVEEIVIPPEKRQEILNA